MSDEKLVSLNTLSKRIDEAEATLQDLYSEFDALYGEVQEQVTWDDQREVFVSRQRAQVGGGTMGHYD